MNATNEQIINLNELSEDVARVSAQLTVLNADLAMRSGKKSRLLSLSLTYSLSLSLSTSISGEPSTFITIYIRSSRRFSPSILAYFYQFNEIIIFHSV